MYLGDYNASATIRGYFNTRTAAGTPITLAGTPAISVYKDGGTTESTAGVTLTVDFDARTGLHLFAITTSSDAVFYSSGSDFRVVITTGTVDGVSVVGVKVAEFSVENRNIRADVRQVAGQTASAAGAVTFPGTIASTTNITAATGVTLAGVTHTGAVIPTVTTTTTATNLTNLPAIPANWLTATGIATGAFTSAKFAAGAFDAVWTVTTRTLSAAGVQAIWDALTSALTTVGSIGKLLVDNINATISSRMASYTQPTGFLTADFTRLDAAVSSRMATFTLPTNFSLLAIDGSGRMTVGAVAANAIDVNAIANGTLTNAKFAVGAIRVAGDELGNTLVLTNLARANQIPTEFTSATFASTGVFSVAALANAPSGGGGGAGDASQATLLQVKAKTDLIVAGLVQWTGMVDENGEIPIPIFIGDDYLAVHGKAFPWEINAIPGLTAATAIVKFGGVNALLNRAWNVTGSATDIGGGRWRLTCEMPKNVSGQLLPGVYDWTVEVSNAGGTEMTVVYSDRKVEVRSKPT